MLSTAGCYAGIQDTYLDRSALLMELTNWDAMEHVRSLCEEILPISPKLALVRTGVPADGWQIALDDCMRSHPCDCVLRLKWRPTYNGG